MRFKDKVVIVTGAAKGIGWGIAKVFAEEGAKVVVVDWDKETGEKTTQAFKQEGHEVIFVECNVSQEDQVRDMVKKT